MEKDKKKQDKQTRKNETVVIINPKVLENCRLPESVIDNIVKALKKYYGNK
jgi:hypothetical protein